jgi:multidrug efflux system membrane fusion protein
MTVPSTIVRVALTVGLVLLACGAAFYLYVGYILYPWTRDGQVRAYIVTIAPRVAGNVVAVHVTDNQSVKKSDPLFEIDPSQYTLAVQAAQQQLEQARQEVASLTASIDAAKASVTAAQSDMGEADRELKRAQEAGNAVSKEFLDEKTTAAKVAADTLAQSQAQLAQATQELGTPGDSNYRIQAAQVALNQAKLNLSWTKVVAPSDGYITNLNVQTGDYADAGMPLLAFVDGTSFWVAGYFMETQLRHMKPGDPAVITLMAHPDNPLKGEVDSVGWAIQPPDVANTLGVLNLVPEIQPTFDWVRLAQRVPVRIKITQVPDGVELIVGLTASVAIRRD